MAWALLDTNMLLAQAQFKVDIWKELDKMGYCPIILSPVLHEVKKIASGRSKRAKAARVALQLIELKKPDMLSERGPADTALIRVAKKAGYAVATNDIELIARLKKQGIKVIRLKQKKRLAID